MKDFGVSVSWKQPIDSIEDLHAGKKRRALSFQSVTIDVDKAYKFGLENPELDFTAEVRNSLNSGLNCTPINYPFGGYVNRITFINFDEWTINVLSSQLGKFNNDGSGFDTFPISHLVMDLIVEYITERNRLHLDGVKSKLNNIKNKHTLSDYPIIRYMIDSDIAASRNNNNNNNNDYMVHSARFPAISVFDPINRYLLNLKNVESLYYCTSNLYTINILPDEPYMNLRDFEIRFATYGSWSIVKTILAKSTKLRILNYPTFQCSGLSKSSIIDLFRRNYSLFQYKGDKYLNNFIADFYTLETELELIFDRNRQINRYIVQAALTLISIRKYRKTKTAFDFLDKNVVKMIAKMVYDFKDDRSVLKLYAEVITGEILNDDRV